MDPNALDTGVTLPLAVDILPIPLVGLRILKLFPIPGNNYVSNRFFFDRMADISQGDFWGSPCFCFSTWPPHCGTQLP